MANRRRVQYNAGDDVLDIRHTEATRKNIPPAGLAAQGKLVKEKKLEYAYNPHLPPRLLFDRTGRADRLNDLLEALGKRELSPSEIEELRALAKADPWLEWTGKQEEQACVVDPVALHIHERVSTQAILKMAQREDVQRSLFADPELDLRETLRFYEHDVDWSNRMILGDSLAVMASLARREALSGKVQMIYCDFPYGIKYASNFQPEVGRREVKDREEDLTREAEMVKAYRDTWTLGVHSYLKYVRDRMMLMRELLSDTGSMFLQISDTRIHQLRTVADEVFGSENSCGIVSFQKTGSVAGDLLPPTVDYLLWYARDRSKIKYRQLYHPRASGHTSLDRYDLVYAENGSIGTMSNGVEGSQECGGTQAQLTSLISSGETKSDQVFAYRGTGLTPKAGSHWKTSLAGMKRLALAGRIELQGERIRYLRLLSDFPLIPLGDRWEAMQIGTATQYVVQTATSVVERCMLMTTDPGDLVLDPTLGSGTSAYVAEEWGRRWIGIDVSRVALAIARQRLMTSRFDYYKLRPTSAQDVSRNSVGPWLRDPFGNIQGSVTFECKTVPHITLKSIAQNQALDPILDKWEPILSEQLEALTAVLPSSITPELRAKLLAKARASLTETQRRRVGTDLRKLKGALSDAEWRRWVMPPDNRPDRPYTTVDNDFAGWYEWEVPFDTDADWPEALQTRLTDYRKAWRQKMDAVNAAIAARADQEELVDQPQVMRGVTRVSGPFSVEGVIPVEESINLEDDEPSPVDEFDGDLETFESADSLLTTDGLGAGSAASEPANAEAYADKMLRLLMADGVRFPDNKVVKFSSLERSGVFGLHAEGEWEKDGTIHRVAVVFGPQYGPLIDEMVLDGMHAAASIGCQDLVFAAFSFDSASQATIQGNWNSRLSLHMAQIRPDVNMGDLLKTTTSSQLFTVSGTPRVVARQVAGGEWQVEMQGVDIYDPVTNSIKSSDAGKVAAWFLDRDYDGRTFCITQAFFPDRKAWEKLAKALAGKVDESVFESFAGTVSLPFKPGRQIAVKVIDPRGNEVMWVKRMAGGPGR